jgi:hypothetical protein
MGHLHISIAAEEVINLFGFPVTNALVATYVTMVLLIFLALYCRFVRIPNWLMMGLTLIWGFCEGSLGKKSFLAFPVVMTLFLFIVLIICGLLPGVASYNNVPLLRSSSILNNALRSLSQFNCKFSPWYQGYASHPLLALRLPLGSRNLPSLQLPSFAFRFWETFLVLLDVFSATFKLLSMVKIVAYKAFILHSSQIFTSTAMAAHE